MPILERAFERKYVTCDTLTSHESLVCFTSLPGDREEPLIYSISFSFNPYPIGSSPNAAGSTQIYIEVIAINDESIIDYPFYLSKGQVLTTNLPIDKQITILSNHKFTSLNTPQLVDCLPLTNTPTNATPIFDMYSIARLKGHTNINTGFIDTVQDVTTLDESTVTKQQQLASDVSFSADIIMKTNDLAYHNVIIPAKRKLETVWMFATQSSPVNNGFWCFGAVNVINNSTSATLKDALKINFSCNWFDGAHYWGTDINQLSVIEKNYYLATAIKAGIAGQS
jgi:hypothetical protein